MKKLEKVKKRINIYDYSLKDLAIYFESFDNYICEIITNNSVIKFMISKNNLPHMVGLHYINNTSLYKGYNGFKKIKNGTINISDLKHGIIKKKEKNNLWNNILLRIEYLPMFFNTLLKNTRLRKLDKTKLIRSTKLKGNYLLFKTVDGLYPILSLKNIKDNIYVIETFIVERDLKLIGSLEEEDIIDIKLYKNKELIY